MLVELLSSRSLRRELRDFCNTVSVIHRQRALPHIYLGEASLVAKMEKAPDAILAGVETVKLDKSEAVVTLVRSKREETSNN
jgi:hypothetical protein